MAGCQSPRRWVELEPYVRPPEEQLAGVATWYASTCRQCPAGCGILVRIMNGRALKIEGNPEHPLNQGKLCARGQAGLQLLYNPDRLPGPVHQAQRGSRQFQALSWNEALNTLYANIEAAGSALAIWGGSTMSGHLYDLFRRFTEAVGAPDPLLFDLYTALNGYPLLARTSGQLFGLEALPVYGLGRADVILSFGADFLGTWLSPVRYGVEFGDFRSQPLGKRGYLVQMEPRMTITGAMADRWLPIRPGSEALVAQALARIIADEEFGPGERVERARALSGEVDVGRVAAACDLPVDELEQLARIFATAERPLVLPGTSLAGQKEAAEATAAVQALNLIAGTAGEIGGLSLSPGSPQPALIKPALSSFGAVRTLIERMRAGEIQLLLVHGANPAYELPEKAEFVEALATVPFVVSFAPIVDETAVQADLILPDRTYLESWGYDVASPAFDLPVVGSQQPVVTPVFDSRSTADVLLTVARGIPAATQALPWADEVAFLKEAIGQLSAGAASGSGLEVLWARFLQHGGWWPTAAPAANVPLSTVSKAIQVTPPEFQGDEQEYPYFLHLYLSDLLNDGRGANQPWLQGSPDPMTTISWQTWVELHPDTARKLGVKDGDIVQVTSPEGELEAPVYVYPAIRPDTVAIPLGQGHTDYGRYARGRGSNPMQLVGTQTDATGSSLAWSALRVKVRPTGEKVALALFENKEGVTEGFLNMEFPE
jgi:anaerobic selenocysteine-containing dehydrogenase